MRATVYPDGRFILAGQIYRCTLGKGGVREHKQEGDGATPAGLLPLRRVLYRADRLAAPDCAFPVEPIAPDDAWCENLHDKNYNRLITAPPGTPGDRLWRDDHVYDIVVVLGWNDTPVRDGHGSAIFLHLTRPDHSPTDGCIGLDLPDLRHVLAAGLREIDVMLVCV